MTDDDENSINPEDGEEYLEHLLTKLMIFNFPKSSVNISRSSALTENEVCFIIDKTVDELQNGCALLELDPPLIVCGDTHGQFHDVLRLFYYNGWPPKTRYLFLGDYVDRGDCSIETICLMFLYKLRHPTDFFLIRGNHETAAISRVYGFYDECKERYSVGLWHHFQTAFNLLPLAALIANRIFCVHGGLSPDLKDIEQIRCIKLPCKDPEEGLAADMLWSDPSRFHKGWKPNKLRGRSYTFGEDVVRKFCRRNGIELICRAHEAVKNGYRFFADKKLVTLFSAPNYCGELNNSAGSVHISETLHCKFRVIRVNCTFKIINDLLTS